MHNKWSCCTALVTACLMSGVAVGEPLTNASAALKQLTGEATRTEALADSAALKLLADMQRYHQRATGLSAEQAASEWLQLAKRMLALEAAEWAKTAGHIDPVTRQAFGPKSLFGILPKPDAWVELNRLWQSDEMRSQTSRQSLALSFIIASLVDDRPAQTAVLKAMRAKATGKDAEQNYMAPYLLTELEDVLIKAHGTPQQILALLNARVSAPGEYAGDIELPDLVTLIGEQAASAWLSEALASSQISFTIPKGSETLRRAQAIALEKIAQLPVPHWGLVRGLDSVALYEAMEQRFANRAASAGDRWAKAEAQTYYLLGLIAHGETAKAVAFSERLSRNSDLRWSRKLLAELDKAGYSKQVYAFLHAQLQKNPQQPLWDMYVKVASYTGHAEQMLDLLRSVVARPGLDTPKVRAHYAAGLLAVDRIEEAAEQLIALLDNGDASDRLERGVQLAEVGSLQANPDWIGQGLDVALAVAASPASERYDYSRERAMRRLLRLLRELDNAKTAQGVVLHALREERGSRESSADEPYWASAMREAPESSGMAVEMAGLYSDAGAWQDLIGWVEGYPDWLAADLSERYLLEDSRKVPLGWYVAKALVMLDRKGEATPILEALISAKGGFDPAYALYAQVKGVAAIPFLQQQYERDAFQERPLIWQASLLFADGQVAAAKQAVQRAIAIDPSDGEQGPGDRMRAYAVLAEILAHEGNAKDSKLYESAVAAVRWSERADRFNDAGMHLRAITLYKQSSEMFSDAYCVQSRLAIKLSNQGRYAEAAAHYRKAYELMPDSFGRVESHCFGCESVFQHPGAQTIAEDVFLGMLNKASVKAQVPYMLGYLRMEQGRYREAAEGFRQAVSIDPLYLNAWKQLHKVSEHVHLDGWERDIAALKLLELDPAQRHVTVKLSEVVDLKGLWLQAQANIAKRAEGPENLYALPAAATAMTARKVPVSPHEMMPVPGFSLPSGKAPRALTAGMVLGQATVLGKALDFAFAR